ncbi:hypothetical protein [Streptomyces sp. NPDC005773]
MPARLFVSSRIAPHGRPRGRFLEMRDAELADEVRTLIVEPGG